MTQLFSPITFKRLLLSLAIQSGSGVSGLGF